MDKDLYTLPTVPSKTWFVLLWMMGVVGEDSPANMSRTSVDELDELAAGIVGDPVRVAKYDAVYRKVTVQSIMNTPATSH